MNAAARFAQVRTQIEATLERRIPSALTPRHKLADERMTCEVANIDRLLEGGLPTGAISEFIGSCGSGRTTTATAFLAAAIRNQKVAAWIDVSDSFDPASAALNGVELSHLLWVRCDAMQSQKDKGYIQSNASTRISHSERAPNRSPEVMPAHEGVQNSQAQREEQHARAMAAPCCYEPKPHRRKLQESHTPLPCVSSPFDASPNVQRVMRPHAAIEHALRATDLLLQAGGFGIIVLDLGDVPAEVVWRIPLATWFRYRAACEHSRTSLLVLTQHPCARSSAGLVIRMNMGNLAAEGSVMTGLQFHASVERQRFAAQPTVVPIRKPPQRDAQGSWKGKAAWAV